MDITTPKPTLHGDCWALALAYAIKHDLYPIRRPTLSLTARLDALTERK